MSTPKADAFLDNLRIDDNENLMVEITLDSNTHTFLLNRHSKPSRNVSKQQALDKIKEKLQSIKGEIVENMNENIRDQCSKDTHFYSWSGLNLEDTSLSIEERMERLNDLITLFCTEKIHLVSTYKNKKETETVEDLWNGFEVGYF